MTRSTDTEGKLVKDAGSAAYYVRERLRTLDETGMRVKRVSPGFGKRRYP